MLDNLATNQGVVRIVPGAPINQRVRSLRPSPLHLALGTFRDSVQMREVADIRIQRTFHGGPSLDGSACRLAEAVYRVTACWRPAFGKVGHATRPISNLEESTAWRRMPLCFKTQLMRNSGCTVSPQTRPRGVSEFRQTHDAPTSGRCEHRAQPSWPPACNDRLAAHLSAVRTAGHRPDLVLPPTSAKDCPTN